jgi:hypothetical protein
MNSPHRGATVERLADEYQLRHGPLTEDERQTLEMLLFQAYHGGYNDASRHDHIQDALRFGKEL